MSYILKEVLANPGNYGGSRVASNIRYLVFHYTGNDGDTASGNANYFKNNIVKASAHYFVDDKFVYRSVPDLKVAWSVGGKKYANADKTGGAKMYGKITNTNSINIEMCDTIKNGTYQASEATMQNAIALAKELMAKYNIPLSNVYRHFDVTGKHCPSYLVNTEKWNTFKKCLEEKEMDNTPATAHKEGVEWAIANGILTGNEKGDLMLSNPITRQQFCTMLYRYHKNFVK
jgi:N-acetylmuramoyl-L-alanine amidase CwlA